MNARSVRDGGELTPAEFAAFQEFPMRRMIGPRNRGIRRKAIPPHTLEPPPPALSRTPVSPILSRPPS